MMKHAQKKFQAFTLVEIVVVVAIISITASVALVSMSSSRTKRELETSAREFISLVREAQNDALTGRQIVIGSVPCAYRIRWNDDSMKHNDYNLRYRYEASGACSANPQVDFTVSRFLKDGVVFSTSQDYISFFPPHAATENISVSKQIILEKNSHSHTICIYANGRIFDQPGTVACP